MSIKGFLVKGQVQKYDYQELENLPPEKIFWAIYNTTTFTNIETALNAGKIVMLKLPSQFNNIIIPFSCFITEEEVRYAKFYGVSGDTRGTSYVYTAQCDEENDFWTMNRSLVSELAPIQRVNNKIGDVVLNASDVGALPASTVIPSKTSDLINDEGFIDTSQAIAAAPVRSVNGQTGTISIPVLPSGGNAGQVLAKASNNDYETEWVNQSSGGSGNDEVFWATYNTTTEAEITTAVTAGKIVLCKISDEIFYLTNKAAIGPSGSAWIFISANQTSIRVTFVSGSYWNSIGTRTITPIPAGGTAGQVLTKASGTDYDTEWVNQSGGVFLVTVTGEGDDTYTADKTYAQIVAAHQAGKTIEVAYGYGHFFLTFWSDDDSDPFMLFSRVHVDFTETIYIDGQGNVQWTQTYLQPHNMGAENAGKILVVGNNGYITMMTREQWESNY